MFRSQPSCLRIQDFGTTIPTPNRRGPDPADERTQQPATRHWDSETLFRRAPREFTPAKKIVPSRLQ